MNPVIGEHFDAIEARLLQSPVVVSYRILRREIALVDGKLRIQATLSDKSIIELFEYVVEVNAQVRLVKYSFHWQDAQSKLRRRWDNAPHHLELTSAPHHVHNPDGTVQSVEEVPDIFQVITEIAGSLRQI